MNILQAAAQLRPGTSWNLRGGVLEQSEDDMPRVAIPTLDEINACIESDPIAYQTKRESEYPPLTDLADALVHQKLGDGGLALDTYLQKCVAIKANYPKPI